MDLENLVERLLHGDARALARALSLVENRSPEAPALVSGIFSHTGSSFIIGLTGPPGAGKSTLADALAVRARAEGRRVAILAVDPTSPFTGGALLGDRARMDSGARDPEVFIRSMATRGHVGGLAGAAFEALLLLEAAGKDFILLETVGAGQDEVEVAAAVDATVVVLAPGFGDELQANKAGIVEIADVLVVNKADRDGADLLAEELSASSNAPPVFKTIASRGEGVEPLLHALLRLAGARPAGEKRRRLVEAWLSGLVQHGIRCRIPDDVWNDAVERLVARAAGPYEVAQRLLDEAVKAKEEKT